MKKKPYFQETCISELIRLDEKKIIFEFTINKDLSYSLHVVLVSVGMFALQRVEHKN